MNGCLRCLVFPMMVTFFLAIYLFRSQIKKIVKIVGGSVKSRKKMTKEDDKSSTDVEES